MEQFGFGGKDPLESQSPSEIVSGLLRNQNRLHIPRTTGSGKRCSEGRQGGNRGRDALKQTWDLGGQHEIAGTRPLRPSSAPRRAKREREPEVSVQSAVAK